MRRFALALAAGSGCLLAAVLIGSAAPAAAQDEVTYRKHIRPLWEEKCAMCHGAESPYYGDFAEDEERYVKEEMGPRMDTYADLIYFIGWRDTGALMRRLDDGKATADGKAGNMYENLGDDDEERQRNLKLFKAWVGQDAWNMKRWNARGDVPGITKEELSRLKLKY
jgi:hypothetical protein